MAIHHNPVIQSFTTHKGDFSLSGVYRFVLVIPTGAAIFANIVGEYISIGGVSV